MLRLELAITNLVPTNHYGEPLDEITLKFGPISTHIPIHDSHGGKTLFLEITPQQLQEIYHLYACGLFLETQHGRYFSLLSLQKIKVEDKVVCQEIHMVNDVRQTKFKCQFSIGVGSFKSPKLPQNNKVEERENVLNRQNKPQVPKQTQHNNFFPSKVPQTFLYGNVPQPPKKDSKLPDHLKTLKNGIPLPKQQQVKSSFQKRQKYSTVPKQMMQKEPEFYDEEDDLFENNPPVMEFTNDEEDPKGSIEYSVPQIGHISYADSVGQLTKQKFHTNVRSPQEDPQLPTFNREGNQIRRPSPETPSEFQLIKKDSRELPPKSRTFTREEIKAMAREDAEAKNNKDNIMIPIAKRGKFELVPLSSLQPDEIIQYVQRQRRTEEQASLNEQKKRRLEEQEQEIRQKNKRLQQIIEVRERQQQKQQQKNSDSGSYMNKRGSKDIRESHASEIVEEMSDDEDKKPEDDYESDFQSMSLTGSLYRSRSRISQKGMTKHISKEESSGNFDEDYSQEFDSYSQSMMSKGATAQKKKDAKDAKEASMSDYSDSYYSISVSQSLKR